MKTVTTISELRGLLHDDRSAGKTVGFVPTMGFLHEGHASLMDAARAATDVVVTSIFVNPLQFAPTEDLAAYPRDPERDAELASARGVDLLFMPDVGEMYPLPVRTTVSVSGPSEVLEGSSRPTHFAGVATVVAKLFSLVGPCHAFFGEKDIQQLAVVRRMVADLSMPVVVVGCPTVRESDGLAMSSRNKYLTDAERADAPLVHAALLAGAAAITAGETDASIVRERMHEVIATASTGTVDYAEVVDADSFETPEHLSGSLRLLAAVQFGGARLIDNIGVEAPSPREADPNSSAGTDSSHTPHPGGATAHAASTPQTVQGA